MSEMKLRAAVPTQPIDVWARINGERVYWFRAHRRALGRLLDAQRRYEEAWMDGLATTQEWAPVARAEARVRYCWGELAQAMGWQR